jgi:3-methylcrotonyl-CoA carboxylase alpha subunit
LVTLQTEDTSQTHTVRVKSTSPGIFDITVNDTTVFTSVPAHLVSGDEVFSSVGGKSLQTTVVSQPPPPSLLASSSPNTMERLHVFLDGRKATFVLPTPKWLLSLGGDVLGAGKGALKAPMPSLVVEVKVNAGDKVEKGQAIVVLESMKTETVLRAEVDGVIKAVGCKNGEMVEEGRELVSIEADGEENP